MLAGTSANFRLAGHPIQESTRGQNYNWSVLRLCEILAVAGDQNRAAGRGGCQIDFIVRVAKAERLTRRFDQSGDSLKFLDDL